MAKTFDLSTLQLSAGTHTIQVKARATSYKDSEFSNSVNYEVIPAGGNVSFTITQQKTTDKNYIKIYDGQDTTGTLLYENYEQNDNTLTPTVTCSSGYLFIEPSGSLVYLNIRSVSGGITIVSWDGTLKVEADGTVNCDVDYMD